MAAILSRPQCVNAAVTDTRLNVLAVVTHPLTLLVQYHIYNKNKKQQCHLLNK